MSFVIRRKLISRVGNLFPEIMIKDKTIVITGAANGIGRAWAEMFKADGAKVIACDKDEERLQELDKLDTISLMMSSNLFSEISESQIFISSALNQCKWSLCLCSVIFIFFKLISNSLKKSGFF